MMPSNILFQEENKAGNFFLIYQILTVVILFSQDDLYRSGLKFETFQMKEGLALH